jgi:hypothetical protein
MSKKDKKAKKEEPVLDPAAAKKARNKAYEAELARLQIEIANLQTWVKESGARIVIIFEGRDAAGFHRSRLEAVDRVLLLHGETDIVEAVEQAMLAERIDVELDRSAVRSADLLFGKIDGDRRIRAAVRVVEELLEILGRHHDRQDPVLEAVVVENVGEACRDHAANAEIEEGPGCVLARGAAAEIVAGDQNLGIAIGRLVEDEIRVLAAVVVVAHLREQALAEAGPLDRLEVILGDDHVGVDIHHVQGGRDGGQRGEFLHGKRPRLALHVRRRASVVKGQALAGGRLARPRLRFPAP